MNKVSYPVNTAVPRGVVMIMPRSSYSWGGAEAMWITVAGWAAAAQRKFGNAWVVTSDCIADAAEVLNYPQKKEGRIIAKRFSQYTWIPKFVKTVAKDVRLWQHSRTYQIKENPPWQRSLVSFVWEQHDIFPGPGRALADRLGVPLVTYVHAPVVWEASKWGVKRYLWGNFLERFVETKSLQRSDLILCVSNEVAQKLLSMGVKKEKVKVSPMAVDPHVFANAIGSNSRKELSLEGKLVIGWTGSFRSFHGLDVLVRAFKKIHCRIPHARLMLVGDGSERPITEKLVQEMELTDAVIFAGRKPFSAIPYYVASFDIALVSARSADGFHYSPLKLREYLVAGRAVLAPAAGEIPESFRDDVHLKLYRPGDEDDLVAKLNVLIENPDLRLMLAEQGREFALKNSTWDSELNSLLAHLSA